MKRINLLKNKTRKPKLLFSFINDTARKILTGLGVIFFVFFLFFIFLTYSAKNNIKKLEKNKQDNLKYLLEDKDFEAKMIFFKSKEELVNSYLKDDAHFLPYYTLLLDSLANESATDSASNSSSLQTVSIDKDRNTEFVVIISKLDSAISFLKYVESQNFLSHFENISLTQFNLLEDVIGEASEKSQQVKESYQFEFKGKFTKIKDDIL